MRSADSTQRQSGRFADFRSRTGFHLRWIFLVALLLGVAVWVYQHFKEPSAAVIVMPNGKTFVIKRVVDSSSVVWPPKRADEKLMDLYNRYATQYSLPGLVSLWPTQQSRIGNMSSDGCLVCDWDRDNTDDGSTCPAWIVVTDANGWRTPVRVPAGNDDSLHTHYAFLPRLPEESCIELELMARDGSLLGRAKIDGAELS